MRLLLPLLALAVIAAGCAKPIDQGPTSTTPSPSTSGGAASSASPVPVKTDTHDFTTGAADGTPAGGAASTAISIPAGVTTLNVTVKFAPVQGAPGAVSDGITVKVGKVTCSVAAGPVTGPSTCTGKSDAAGVKAIEYSGAGPVVATVTIVGT